MELKQIPILKTKEGKIVSLTVSADSNKILVVNNFSANPLAYKLMLGQTIKIYADPNDYFKKNKVKANENDIWR